MKIWDTFIFNDELDMLECRLTELKESPIWRHVIVEATRGHRGQPKPLHFLENRKRFAPWRDRIRHVVAGSLPDSPDPWVREHAQREYTWSGITDAKPDDLILHGDVDEIPSAAAIDHLVDGRVSLDEPLVLLQRHYMYAVDWQYPQLVWPGTIAARRALVEGFQWLRAQRFDLAGVMNAGWHLSWMGGLDAQVKKLGEHCHLEMTDVEAKRISSGRAYREGLNHGGARMIGVDVDETWPRYVYERKCPESWFRPRQAANLSA